MTKGWKLESARHSLARKGIKTKQLTISKQDKRKEFSRIVNERAIELIQEAEKQFEKYEKTQTYSSFVQTNEKAWMAFKHKISSIAGVALVKANQIRAFTKKNPKYYNTYKSAIAMHTFSFSGDILPPPEVIKPYLNDIKRFVK